MILNLKPTLRKSEEMKEKRAVFNCAKRLC